LPNFFQIHFLKRILNKEKYDIAVIDFHAEATAEKIALAYYLKDKANIIYGTHTHVQTSDERIFDTGMGYITDLGMTGPKESVLGMKVEIAIKRFTTQIPEKYAVAEGEYIFNGAIFDIDDKTNKVNEIIRINM
jgi:calcineurin-like phosphoesterase